jgi:hypothetical protein
MDEYIFHRKISEENKERLTKAIEIIRNTLENEQFVKSRVSNKRNIDLPNTPIDIITLGFIKGDVQYRISVEIMC